MAWDKKRALSALDGIDDDLGMRAGKDALASPRGTAATKAPQEPGAKDQHGAFGSGAAEPQLATDRTPHDPHTGPARQDTAPHYQHMDGAGKDSAVSAHVTSGPYRMDANDHAGSQQGTGNSSAQAMVSSYLAQGYSPQDHAAHLSEHWDLPVSHMIGKHIKRQG